MTRSFGRVDYKVQEAEYFLLELRRLTQKWNIAAVQFCTSAFVSAARSITYAMQASLKGHPKFQPWYEVQRRRLKQNALSRFFHDFRRMTHHIGSNTVRAAESGPDGPRYYFLPCDDLPVVPDIDVLSACENYFKNVLRLVYDCYLEFGNVIDGQQFFTKENFDSLGKTIEDAEEEIGFPRGFTDIGKPNTESYRWELLRRQADGCQIEQQFWNWLQLSLPQPHPLPPYQPCHAQNSHSKSSRRL